ncbi:MAG: ribosome small subunit-dependent GTPase A [Lachnospiraceae bacterium]|nr:ribosome small subunit-dependent GTPase A [Lachnospiraceae bacterium]
MKGRIIKGIAGFYYVYASDDNIYECKARGIFRKNNIKPMVGDIVSLDVLNEQEMTGNISEVFERKNELIRPAVANVDLALIVFALKNPEPDYLMLDKLLLQFKMQKLPVVICFNKEDLSDKVKINSIFEIYQNSGAGIIFTCAVDGQGIEELKKLLTGKLSCVAGPSGVGKSSLINCLRNEVVAGTGDISKKLKRGKHTTRHSEIIPIDESTFIMDTPGFGKVDIFIKDRWLLKEYYDEFFLYEQCRFKPCSHTHEPDCAVKEAVKQGLVAKERYDNYAFLFSELEKIRRY